MAQSLLDNLDQSASGHTEIAAAIEAWICMMLLRRQSDWPRQSCT
ncbi:hypothetical protein GP2143_02599 [marine gamma proteobacterium HTCC2143]|uniref:Uncharacterized protein n=1 Tax=marine gamma proteobacterium HTCC2143 TaxID=247633 RepID=A0YEE1_9GAMM|nr:hypothetical protein GP2143_02599 [marine gamma proteobacterium HTCC2143]